MSILSIKDLRSRTGSLTFHLLRVCTHVAGVISASMWKKQTHSPTLMVANITKLTTLSIVLLVIYMLTYPCGLIYVGKTKRQLKVRVGEHVQRIIKKDDECPLSLHFLKVHGGEPKGLKCKGIYRLNLPPTRGDFDRILYQKEKMWIFNLNSMQPFGLNNECNLSVFLEQ